MFVSSDWEPDVPKVDVSFGKKAAKRKLPKNLTTLTNLIAPVKGGSRHVKTEGVPTKPPNKKYEKPVNTLTKLSSPQKTTSSESTTKRKKSKNTSLPGTFVRNPAAIIPDSSKDSAANEKQDKPLKEVPVKSNGRKLPKNLTTLTNLIAPVKGGSRHVKTEGVPTKPPNKKYEKPVNTLTKLSSPQKTTSSESTTKRKKSKNTSLPGTFVRNPAAIIPDSSKDSAANEKQDKPLKEVPVKSNGVSKPSKPINNTDKSNTNSKKRKNEAPADTKAKKFKLSEITKSRLNQSLDKPDELLKLKRKQLDDIVKTENREDLLYKEPGHKTKGQIMKSKERLKKVLNKGFERNSVKAGGNKLRERMLEKLKAAQFRYLNEKLYTSSGSEAQQLFQADPVAFQTYHEGYQLQLKKWPVNPLDVIIKSILKMPKTITIADMGCGEAVLAKRVPQKVRSFDLVARAPGVEACDMARTPLLAGSVDVAVYCLALMGTDLTQYLLEANRVLKQGGLLLIAEVESRFDDVDAFALEVSKLGFKLLKLDKSQQVFYFLEFRKMQPPPAKKAKQPRLSLKPCIYKRR